MIENPIPKPLQKMLVGFGIDPDDLFIKIKSEVEKIKCEDDKNEI